MRRKPVATNPKIEELAAVLESSLYAGFNPQGYTLYRELIILLAEGRPVSPERVAGVLGLAREEVIELLRQRPSIEWDEAENIVGAGLTLHSRHAGGLRLSQCPNATLASNASQPLILNELYSICLWGT